jgi:hypothetical protein
MKAGILQIITPETRLTSYIHRGVFPISAAALESGIIPQKEARGTRKQIKEFILKNFDGYCSYIERHYGASQREKFIHNNFQAGGMNVEPRLAKFEGAIDPELIVDEVHKEDSVKTKPKKLTTQQMEVETKDEFPSVVVKRLKKNTIRLVNLIEKQDDLSKVLELSAKPAEQEEEEEEDDEKLEALFKKFGMEEVPPSFTPSFLQKNATSIRPHRQVLNQGDASKNKKSYIN